MSMVNYKKISARQYPIIWTVPGTYLYLDLRIS